MENDFEKEKIGLLKTEMGHLWNGFFIAGGGTIAFIVSASTVLHTLFAIVGTISVIFLLKAYFIRREIVLSIIYKMEERK